MPSPRTPSDPVELLAQTEWLARLATALVPAAERDDLVQDVLLSALQREQRPHSLRAWLATVARNRAARLRRRGEARRERERATAERDGAEPGTADAVAAFALHRSVVEAVTQLREPYRGALLLRYWEDLQPTEIARRLGVPVETVRTRLKRATAQLREKLDDGHGTRAAWLVPLLNLPAVQKALPASGGVTTSVAAGIVQGAIMTKYLWTAAAGLALVVGGAAFFAFGRDAGGVTPPADGAASARAAGAQVAELAEHEAADRIERQVVATVIDAGTLQVRVHDVDERPCEACAVHVLRVGRQGRTIEASTDAQGRATFAELAAGDYVVSLALGPRADVRVEPGDVARCSLQVGSGVRVVGRVVTPDGQPRAGARVSAQLHERPEVELPLATTDDDGRFVLAGVASGTTLVARAAGWQPSLPRHGEVRAAVGAEVEVELRLGARGHRLSGVVLRPDGSPVAEALVVIGVDEDSHKHVEGVRELRTGDGNGRLDRESFLVHADEHGAFDTHEVPWGSAVVLARGVGEHGGLVGGVVTTVHRGVDNTVTVRVDEGASVHGTVRDEQGQPYEGLELRLDYEGSVAFGEFDRDVASPVVTDRVGVVAADGTFSIAGLLAADYDLLAVFPRQPQRLERIELRAGEQRRLDLVVPRSWSLQVLVQDGDGAPLAGHAVWLSSDATIRFVDAVECRTGSDGRFTANGLQRDEYVLSVHAPDRDGDWPVQRMPAFVRRVVRGEPDVVAVVPAPTPSLTARVLAETGRPAAGARVELSQEGFGEVLRTTADEHGRFDYADLPPGEYRYEVRDRGPALEGRVATSPGVACDLGDLMLPPVAPFDVVLQTANGPPPFTQLTLFAQAPDSQGGSGWVEVTSARTKDGHWRCERVTTGRYRLHVAPRDHAPSVHDLDLQAGTLRELQVVCRPGVEQRLDVVVRDLGRMEPGHGYTWVEVEDDAGRSVVDRYTSGALGPGHTLPVTMHLLEGHYRVRVRDLLGHAAADLEIGPRAGPPVRVVMQPR